MFQKNNYVELILSQYSFGCSLHVQVLFVFKYYLNLYIYIIDIVSVNINHVHINIHKHISYIYNIFPIFMISKLSKVVFRNRNRSNMFPMSNHWIASPLPVMTELGRCPYEYAVL